MARDPFADVQADPFADVDADPLWKQISKEKQELVRLQQARKDNEQTSGLEQAASGALGAANAMSLGFADEARGGIAAAAPLLLGGANLLPDGVKAKARAAAPWFANLLPDDPISGLADRYTAARDQQRGEAKASESRNLKSTLAGEVVGQVPTLVGGAAAKVPQALAEAAKRGVGAVALEGAKAGGLGGAAGGAGIGEGVQDTVEKSVIGGALGVLFGGVGGALGGLLNPETRAATEAAARARMGAKTADDAAQAAAKAEQAAAPGIMEQVRKKVADAGGIGNLAKRSAAKKVPIVGDELADVAFPMPKKAPAGKAKAAPADLPDWLEPVAPSGVRPDPPELTGGIELDDLAIAARARTSRPPLGR